MTVAAVVLAAGASRRLGRPKQNLRFGTQTLLERTVQIAHAAGLSPVFTVISLECRLPEGFPATLLINRDTAEGMSSSIRIGIHAVDRSTVKGVVILACDQPAVTAEHLVELIRNQDEIAASAYAGRKGVPAFFPSTVFERLMGLSGDSGARHLIANARAIPLSNGELDIDTPDDLTRAQTLYPDIESAPDSLPCCGSTSSHPRE